MTTAVSLAQSVAPGVSLGFKNRIINGGMMIDQRNSGAAYTSVSNGTYTLDRWAVNEYVTGGKFNIQQNAGSVTPPAGFTKYLGATSTSAYSASGNDIYAIYQRIEGYNIADLAWGTANASAVTLSFKVYSSLTGTFGGSLQNGAGNRSYPFTYTIGSANTWTSISITVAGDTTGTWATDNSIGLQVTFGLGAGSTYSGTAGAWAAGNYLSATGATSVVGTSGATFYITGVQLEVGTAATPFEFRDYGRELIMCQRYCEIPEIGTANVFYFFSGPYNATTQYMYKVQKRATPTLTVYGVGGYPNGATGKYDRDAVGDTSITASYSRINSFYLNLGGSNISGQCAFKAEAEL